jgi:hypothetical protein
MKIWVESMAPAVEADESSLEYGSVWSGVASCYVRVPGGILFNNTQSAHSTLLMR